MTALVKGSIAQSHTPSPPEAHVIKYARGGAIEIYGRCFSRYFSELGSISKKALHLKPTVTCRALMPFWRDKTKPSSKLVCDRQTDTQKK